MRIVHKVAIDVDVAAYRAEYGEPLSLEDIRGDIIQDLEYTLDQTFPGRIGKDIFPKIEVT